MGNVAFHQTARPVLGPAHVISYIVVFCVISPGLDVGRVHNFIFVLGEGML
jgi:hypothetical protein